MTRSFLTRPALAWASYDFANSTFSTSVLSVIFSVYFARVVVPPEGLHVFGMTIPGESLWGYLISAAMAVVLLMAPGLGARADRRGEKRFHLRFWASVGALATMALVLATPGRVGYGVLVSFIAILGFEMSLVFYNAFLNDLSDDANRGRLSGLGFAFGYIGGGLCLALNMAMMAKPAWFGLASTDTTLAVRMSIFVAGAWWLLFSLPAFFLLRDRPPVAARHDAPHPASQLWRTAREIAGQKDLARFLLAYLIYDDGIQTIILMASIFGAKALGMTTAQLAACFLLIQFVAFIGALVAGRVADAFNHKSVVVVTLAAFFGVSLWGTVIDSQREFWVLGVVVGLVMGGAQAASRSLFSLMVPPAKNGEYFALFSIVGKAAALAGPFVFGLSSQIFGLRPAVAVIGLFFVVGGAILLTVDEKRGKREAGAVPV